MEFRRTIKIKCPHCGEEDMAHYIVAGPTDVFCDNIFIIPGEAVNRCKCGKRYVVDVAIAERVVLTRVDE